MLQSKSKSILIRSLILVTISSAIFSFSAKFGGDVFEIYLNNKLISQQFVTRHEAVKTLQLDQSVSDALVIVKYSHCGVTGTARHIILKDENNAVVKEWTFADAKDNDNNMSCKVKDILALKNSYGSKFNLYYSSKELPGGRLIASVVVNTDTKRSS